MAIHYLECAALTDLPAGKKLALMAIADDADKTTRIGRVGLDGIMQWSGLKRSRALEVLKELVDDGYLVRHASGRIGRQAEFVVFPAGCCPLHGPVRGHTPTPGGSGPADPPPPPAPVDEPVDTAVDSPVDDAQRGSGTPDPAPRRGSGRGSATGSDSYRTPPYPPIELPPNPPPSGGRCDPTRPVHDNCRGCGTTRRQLTAADRKRTFATRHSCPVHGPAGWTNDGTCRGCAADRKAAS